jgi:hypothetical protein
VELATGLVDSATPIGMRWGWGRWIQYAKGVTEGL